MSTASTKTEARGLQFPAGADGKRSSAAAATAILAAALEPLDAAAAASARQEKDWRHAYQEHVWRLVERAAAEPARTAASCEAGLAAAWQAVQFVRGGRSLALADAMRTPRPDALQTVELRGGDRAGPARWEVPYHGQRLHGDTLLRRVDDWERRGVVEPSHAAALRLAQAHPQWFDLSDRTMVLLGAASEAGPLRWLARWRANLVAVDVPRAATWQRITQTVREGNGRLIAPVDAAAAHADPAQALKHAGCDLLTQTGEIAAWLAGLKLPLDIASLAYLDGEKHLRVSIAMDAIVATLCAADARTSLAYLATPTDVFAVPEDLARAVMSRYEDRGLLKRAAQAGIRAGSGGRTFLPHIESLVTASDGARYGIVDALVLEQGPNYAIAKRLQQWRAIVERARGHVASINVAPSTTTQSVLSNPALAAGFRGAKAFDVEVFEPDTTNAIMAALWVHDLRNPKSAAHPGVPLANPLLLLCEGANHGGLWRLPYLPRSVLPFAALLGLVKRR
jgi:hypothetical protein